MKQPSHRSSKPPALAKRFLLRFLRDDLAEEVQGDLDEQFHSIAASGWPLKAKLNYWLQVCHYFRPFAIRKSKSLYLNDHAMFANYLKTGWRSMSRQKGYAAIKIGGFAAGIAACLLIALFIRQELSYDRHYANQDRIYRVLREGKFGDNPVNMGIHFPAPFASVLREEYPDIELAGHYMGGNFGTGRNEVRRIDRPDNAHEEGFIFADQDLLTILELPFVAGNPQRALTEPQTMVITQRKADLYFPGEDPLGKVVIINNDENRQYTITGVVRNFPATSHFSFDFLMTTAGHELWPGEQTNWSAGNYIDYIRVRPGTNIAALETKLSGVLTKYFLPYTIENGNDAGAINWVKSLHFKLQPVSAIYMNRENVWDGLSHGDIRYVWIFGAIAVFILVIACINFINLSTAKSANRAREVGLRKVVGSSRGSLVKLFLTESIIYSVASFALGLLAAQLLLPGFNDLLAKSLAFPWKAWWFIPMLAGAAITIGIIAGLYPSFYLSSFRPALVLKGNTGRGSRIATTRSVLVVFQFAVSIILVTGTFAIHRQMNYILTKKLGFDKDQVLIVEGTHTLPNVVSFKEELLRLASVKNVSITDFIPIDGAKRNGGPAWTDGITREEGVSTQFWSVDHDYIKTMGLKLLKGRDFRPELASDSQAMVINESLAKALHLNDPIGKPLYNLWKGKFTIIGVVEDFHFESLRKNITPLALTLSKNSDAVLVKINTADMSSVIDEVTTVWKKFSPHQPIRFTFLDQGYARMYDDVKRTETIFTGFALLAVLVACLGLFALSAFMIEQRGKEISIRLVLGASLKSIFGLLTSNFIRMVLIAFVIAAPIAFVLLQKWLDDFAYKITPGWELFATAGLLSVVIALVTIGYQSIRAALADPVQNLRAE